MTRTEMQTRINDLRNELENRFKYGTVKLANKDGSAISAQTLQTELYNLIYRMSKID